MPPGQHKAVWVSLDGNKWYYQHHDGYENCRELSARDVFERPSGSQRFVGFDLGNALGEARRICNEFVKNRERDVQRLFERAIAEFKEALKNANLKELQSFSKPRSKGVAPRKYAKDKKRAKLKGVYEESRDGMTIFESFYHEADSFKKDASGRFHKGVHKLRVDVEAIRFALMDVQGSFNDLHDVLNTPKELQGDARHFRKSIIATKTCMSKVKLSIAGPIGSIINGVKTGVERGFGALEKSVQKAEDSLDGVEKRFNLAQKKKKLQGYQKKLKEKAPFKKFEEFNFRLAELEKQSGNFSDQWPRLKPELPEECAKRAEQSLQSGERQISSVAGKLKDVAEQSRTVSGVLGPLNTVVMKKQEFRDAYQPVLNLFNQLEKALMTIYQRVLKPILELPIVKDILAWVSSLCDWLARKIMEFTGLDKLADWLAEKCNPFASFIDDALGDLKKLANIELELDVLTALNSSEDMKLIEVPNLKDLRAKTRRK